MCFVLFVPSHCLESYIFSGHSSVHIYMLQISTDFVNQREPQFVAEYSPGVFYAGLQSVMEGGSDTFVT